ncbi:MAG: hypothetical protein Q4A12_08325 [Eubacteriales bacterium]|nr:hypothetical protein [Eubacteriales bacterium]
MITVLFVFLWGYLITKAGVDLFGFIGVVLISLIFSTMLDSCAK